MHDRLSRARLAAHDPLISSPPPLLPALSPYSPFRHMNPFGSASHNNGAQTMKKRKLNDGQREQKYKETAEKLHHAMLSMYHEKDAELEQAHTKNQLLQNKTAEMEQRLRDLQLQLVKSESTLQSAQLRYEMTNLDHLSLKQLSELSEICTQNLTNIQTAIERRNDCVVCCEHERDAVLQCGHLIMCHHCVNEMLTQPKTRNPTCPLCKQPFSK
eukprot:CAMPEP_0202688142 /NCGR_PEP_ID=MMETSP1385-20130828/3673_1 /ASSEMBLY_ACC=CAM_ASM_000861 /TAXON_ID=933848 /ORGANISM="Elphidium margaritaceum" /LENGTH=213 /DNA_ID=CAMNT_0049343041 /DNA_START=23 /DNA_END=661 /DNA_ORIENTATION=+